MRKDGKFVCVDGTILVGQGIVMAHLNECHELLEMVRSILRINLRESVDVHLTHLPQILLLAKAVYRQCRG